MSQVVEVAEDGDVEEERSERGECRDPVRGRAAGAVSAGERQRQPRGRDGYDQLDDIAAQSQQNMQEGERQVGEKLQRPDRQVVAPIERDRVRRPLERGGVEVAGHGPLGHEHQPVRIGVTPVHGNPRCHEIDDQHGQTEQQIAARNAVPRPGPGRRDGRGFHEAKVWQTAHRRESLPSRPAVPVWAEVSPRRWRASDRLRRPRPTPRRARLRPPPGAGSGSGG